MTSMLNIGMSKTHPGSLLRGSLVAASLTLLSAQSAHAQIIANGGFETVTPPVANGTSPDFFGGSTAITGWTVVGNDVLVVNTNYGESGNGISQFNAFEGLNSVDLTGASNTGTNDGVRQTISTVQGQQYNLSFYLGQASGNAGVYSSQSIADVQFGSGARTSYAFTDTLNPGKVAWQQFVVPFVAAGSTTTITIYNGTSATTNNYVGLDNVVVNQASAPEASPVALLAIGLPLVGLVVVRRRFAQA